MSLLFIILIFLYLVICNFYKKKPDWRLVYIYILILFEINRESQTSKFEITYIYILIRFKK